MTVPVNAATDLQTLEKRSYKTYKARLKASERLAARGQAWNASMYGLSSALAVAAIGMLTDEDLYGAQRDTLMAGLSLLSLVASLVVGQLNYAVRSRDLQGNYKSIQFVAQDAEYYKTHDPTRQHFERILDEYRDLIREGENQTSGDNYRGQGEGYKHLVCYKEALVTAAPFASLAAPILLLIPLVKSFT